MTRYISISIEGFLVGTIWQGIEGYKTLNYSILPRTADSVRMTLREHVQRATSDGDFISCVIGAGTLNIDITTMTAGRCVRRSRAWPLERFKSIADMLHPDAGWIPSSADDYYEEEISR